MLKQRIREARAEKRFGANDDQIRPLVRRQARRRLRRELVSRSAARPGANPQEGA